MEIHVCNQFLRYIIKVFYRYSTTLVTLYITGKAICFASFIAKIFLTLSENLLTAGLSLYKLHLLRTLANLHDTFKLRLLVSGIWGFSGLYILLLIVANIEGNFDAQVIGCQGHMAEKGWDRFKHLAGMIFTLIPILIIIVTNVWMLLIAMSYTKQHSQRQRPKLSTVITVSCICWVFTASWLPYLIVWTCKFLTIQVNKVWFTVAEHAISLNVVLNPFIYTASNKSFRVFVIGLIRRGPAAFSATSS